MLKKIQQIFDPAYLKGGEREVGAKKYGWHKDWKEEKVFMFTWDYCSLCDVMFVRCPACFNNCCNAGFGTLNKNFQLIADSNDPEAIKCPICNLAYQFQESARKGNTEPKKPSKKECKRIRAEDKKAEEKFWASL